MVKTNVDFTLAIIALAIATAVIVLYALDYINVRAAVPLLGLGHAAITHAVIPFEGPPGRNT